jgi:hypothetical protein
VQSTTEATPSPADETPMPNHVNTENEQPPVRTSSPDTPIAQTLVAGAGEHTPPDPKVFDRRAGRARSAETRGATASTRRSRRNARRPGDIARPRGPRSWLPVLVMPRIPAKEHQHGNGDDWHETIDGFDSHAKMIGEARSDVFMPTRTRSRSRKWAREQEERDRRRRPLGFAAWPE